MDKDVLVMVVVLGFFFILTLSAHMLYVEGYAFPKPGAHQAEHAQTISVYGTKEECESNAKGECHLQLCDDIPAGKNYEDICGAGFREGWLPKAERSSH